ncbi:ABC transporter substrate-binding protein [Aureicoccus marinus]|uniref:ABC transporter substrate-binding protein n=1 Tax=Aureicoccus marinus TaxID=754435 RepID=A0A2S7T5N6_9FLAO|nr:ABC transporter substrate-binding protein [Aureicoccus marinus]PQJ14805.1 ABC transporter substrate-binding protein [Aureicoccus marinus]
MKKNTLFGFALFGLLLCSICLSCKQETPKKEELSAITGTESVAKGFEIEQAMGYKILHIRNPWPGEAVHYRYAVLPENTGIELPSGEFDGVVQLPLKRIVVTSTTHIPALEELGALDRLVGFPGVKYISSAAANTRIKNGQIKEIGPNGQLNVEEVLALQPDVVIGYGMGPDNRSFEALQRAGVPVVLNGDWTETHPLGKAEWIRFFGLFLDKEEEADEYFTALGQRYKEAKELVSSTENKPLVLSGAVFKDVWYAPAGESWAATFLRDAGADYLWKEEKGTGSLSLSLEEVLTKGSKAQAWVAPSQFTSYTALKESSVHYSALPAFQNKKVFTFSKTKGEGGGVLYYELAPYQPDVVLKDLIHLLHPEVLPDYQPFFFLPLDP